MLATRLALAQFARLMVLWARLWLLTFFRTHPKCKVKFLISKRRLWRCDGFPLSSKPAQHPGWSIPCFAARHAGAGEAGIPKECRAGHANIVSMPVSRRCGGVRQHTGNLTLHKANIFKMKSFPSC